MEIPATEVEQRSVIRCSEGCCILVQWSSPDKETRTLQIRDLVRSSLRFYPNLALRGKCRCKIVYTIYLPQE